MQATQTRSQGQASARRAAIAIVLLVAAVLITLSTVYLAKGRTSGAAHTASAQVQVARVAAGSWTTHKPDEPQAATAAASGLRQNGPLP
jgi:hypothetical protein